MVVPAVVVAETTTRLVMVEVEFETKMPPEMVASPVAVIVPIFERLPPEEILSVPAV